MEDDAEYQPIPWDDWDRALASEYGWTPQQIDDLTLPEILAFLPVDPETRGKNDPRAAEWRQMYSQLTPEQKLMVGYIEQGRRP